MGDLLDTVGPGPGTVKREAILSSWMDNQTGIQGGQWQEDGCQFWSEQHGTRESWLCACWLSGTESQMLFVDP